jgi:hypothetical protein
MNGCVHLDVWATNGTKIYFAGTPAGRVAGRGVPANRFAGTPFLGVSSGGSCELLVVQLWPPCPEIQPPTEKPFYLMLTLCMNLRHLKGKTMAMAMACKTMALLGV